MFTKRKLFRIAMCGVSLMAISAATAEAQRPESDDGTRRVRRADNGRRGASTAGPEMLLRLPVIVALDADQDGTISAKEIENAAAALKKLDKNRDGKIDMREMMMPSRSAETDATGMIERLMQRDKDGDGFLTSDEMPGLLSRIVKRDDENGDGKLSREEVAKSVQALIRKRAGNLGGDGPGGQRPKKPSLKE